MGDCSQYGNKALLSCRFRVSGAIERGQKGCNHYVQRQGRRSILRDATHAMGHTRDRSYQRGGRRRASGLGRARRHRFKGPGQCLKSPLTGTNPSTLWSFWKEKEKGDRG